MITGDGGDFGVEIIMPSNSSTLPDWTRAEKFIFIRSEHVRSRYLEGVVRKALIDEFVVMMVEPDFLEKDDFGF